MIPRAALATAACAALLLTGCGGGGGTTTSFTGPDPASLTPADAPLFRARIVKLADDNHRLYFTLHHIIFDGVAIYRVIVPELAKLYDAFSRGACTREPCLRRSRPRRSTRSTWAR